MLRRERLGIGKHIQVREFVTLDTSPPSFHHFYAFSPTFIATLVEKHQVSRVRVGSIAQLDGRVAGSIVRSTCKNYCFRARAPILEVEVVEEFALRAKFPNRKWQSRMRGRAKGERTCPQQTE